MKKPNAFVHMFFWGIVSGVALGALFSVAIVLYAFVIDPYPSSYRLLNDVIGVGYFGAVVGAVAGTALGFFNGIGLWAAMRTVQLPISLEQLLRLQKRTPRVLAAFTFFGMFFVSPTSLLVFINPLAALVPPIVAAFTAYVVSRRYFVRLAKVSQKPKAKAKAT